MTLPLIRQGAGPMTAYLAKLDETIEREQRISRILIQAESNTQPATMSRATLPGDTRRLRGIPVIANGVGGTSPGTRPDQIAT